MDLGKGCPGHTVPVAVIAEEAMPDG